MGSWHESIQGSAQWGQAKLATNLASLACEPRKAELELLLEHFYRQALLVSACVAKWGLLWNMRG